MSRPAETMRYEARKREAGFVRGPRITADAAERLRTLAFRHQLTPSEVVTRLLLDIPLSGERRECSISYQLRERLSDEELRLMAGQIP